MAGTESSRDGGAAGSTETDEIDVSEHDAVLAAIPASMAVAAAVGAAFSLSIWTVLAAGSVPATGTIGYALFYNPPAA